MAVGLYSGAGRPAEPDPASLAWLPGAEPSCFLCKGVAAGADRDGPADRQNLIVGRTELSVVMLNRYPYNNGHLLIAPLLHKGRLDELEDEEHLDCQRTVARCIGLVERELKAEAFNVGLNLGAWRGPACRATCTGISCRVGTAIPISWPRWPARVIPQALEALWEALDAAWRTGA